MKGKMQFHCVLALVIGLFFSQQIQSDEKVGLTIPKLLPSKNSILLENKLAPAGYFHQGLQTNPLSPADWFTPDPHSPVERFPIQLLVAEEHPVYQEQRIRKAPLPAEYQSPVEPNFQPNSSATSTPEQNTTAAKTVNPHPRWIAPPTPILKGVFSAPSDATENRVSLSPPTKKTTLYLLIEYPATKNKQSQLSIEDGDELLIAVGAVAISSEKIQMDADRRQWVEVMLHPFANRGRQEVQCYVQTKIDPKRGAARQQMRESGRSQGISFQIDTIGPHLRGVQLLMPKASQKDAKKPARSSDSLLDSPGLQFPGEHETRSNSSENIPSTHPHLILTFEDDDLDETRLSTDSFLLERMSEAGPVPILRAFSSDDIRSAAQQVRLKLRNLPPGSYRISVSCSKQDQSSGPLGVALPLHDLSGNLVGSVADRSPVLQRNSFVIAATKTKQESNAHSPSNRNADADLSSTKPSQGTGSSSLMESPFENWQKEYHQDHPARQMKLHIVPLIWNRDASRIAETIRTWQTQHLHQRQQNPEGLSLPDLMNKSLRLREPPSSEVELKSRIKQIEHRLQGLETKGRAASKTYHYWLNEVAEGRATGEHNLNAHRKVAEQFLTEIQAHHQKLEELKAELYTLEHPPQVSRSPFRLLRYQQSKSQLPHRVSQRDADAVFRNVAFRDQLFGEVQIAIPSENTLQLYGPLQGVQKVRELIYQLDQPRSSVDLDFYTIRFTGTSESRLQHLNRCLNSESNLIQQQTQLTLQCLKRAVQETALSIVNHQVSGSDTGLSSIEERPLLVEFYGEAFIKALEKLDRDVLNADDSPLSLHFTGNLSLNRTVCVLSLAKKETQQQILHHFQSLMMYHFPELAQTNSALSANRASDSIQSTIRTFPSLSNLLGSSSPVVLENLTLSQRDFLQLVQLVSAHRKTHQFLKQKQLELSLLQQDRLAPESLQKLREEFTQEILLQEEHSEEEMQRAAWEILSGRKQLLQFNSQLALQLKEGGRLANDLASARSSIEQWKDKLLEQSKPNRSQSKNSTAGEASFRKENSLVDRSRMALLNEQLQQISPEKHIAKLYWQGSGFQLEIQLNRQDGKEGWDFSSIEITHVTSDKLLEITKTLQSLPGQIRFTPSLQLAWEKSSQRLRLLTEKLGHSPQQGLNNAQPLKESLSLLMLELDSHLKPVNEALLLLPNTKAESLSDWLNILKHQQTFRRVIVSRIADKKVLQRSREMLIHAERATKQKSRLERIQKMFQSKVAPFHQRTMLKYLLLEQQERALDLKEESHQQLAKCDQKIQQILSALKEDCQRSFQYPSFRRMLWHAQRSQITFHPIERSRAYGRVGERTDPFQSDPQSRSVLSFEPIVQRDRDSVFLSFRYFDRPVAWNRTSQAGFRGNSYSGLRHKWERSREYSVFGLHFSGGYRTHVSIPAQNAMQSGLHSFKNRTAGLNSSARRHSAIQYHQLLLECVSYPTLASVFSQWWNDSYHRTERSQLKRGGHPQERMVEQFLWHRSEKDFETLMGVPDRWKNSSDESTSEKNSEYQNRSKQDGSTPSAFPARENPTSRSPQTFRSPDPLEQKDRFPLQFPSDSESTRPEEAPPLPKFYLKRKGTTDSTEEPNPRELPEPEAGLPLDEHYWWDGERKSRSATTDRAEETNPVTPRRIEPVILLHVSDRNFEHHLETIQVLPSIQKLESRPER